MGLQTRGAPAVVPARALIATGRIGTVGAATLLATRATARGGTLLAWAAYTLERTNCAGTLRVMGGHALDVLEYLLDPFECLSAELAVRHPRLRIAESGQEGAATSPDHLGLTGVLGGGVPVTVAVRDAETAPPRTCLEIAGSAGNLAIFSPRRILGRHPVLRRGPRPVELGARDQHLATGTRTTPSPRSGRGTWQALAAG